MENSKQLKENIYLEWNSISDQPNPWEKWESEPLWNVPPNEKILLESYYKIEHEIEILEYKQIETQKNIEYGILKKNGATALFEGDRGSLINIINNMIQIILLIAGVVALFRKNIGVTMKSELRRPKIYIFGIVTIILTLISTIFSFIIKEGAAVQVLWWISVITPIILAFSLKQKKLSLIENPELKVGRSKIEKYIWITIGVALIVLIAYAFINSHRMNLEEKERQEQELLRQQQIIDEMSNYFNEN